MRQRPTGSPLEADFAAGRTLQRFGCHGPARGASLSDVVYERFGVTLTVDSPEPFIARYLSFAFPGWSAARRRRTKPIAPEDPRANYLRRARRTHEDPRQLGRDAFAAGAGGAEYVVGGGGDSRGGGAKRWTVDDSRRTAALASLMPLRRSEWVILGLLVVGLLGVKVCVDNHESPLRRPAAPPVGPG